MSEQEGIRMDIDEEVNQSQSEEQPQPQTQEIVVDGTKSVNVNLAFIVNYKKIIDIAISRGTFKSDEIPQIGLVITDLNNLIKQNIN